MTNRSNLQLHKKRYRMLTRSWGHNSVKSSRESQDGREKTETRDMVILRCCRRSLDGGGRGDRHGSGPIKVVSIVRFRQHVNKQWTDVVERVVESVVELEELEPLAVEDDEEGSVGFKAKVVVLLINNNSRSEMLCQG